jgi:hypothetical protein
MTATARPFESDPLDSRYSWTRLALSLAIASIGNVGMWSVIVVMPAVQAEFGTGRGRGLAALYAHHAGLRAGQSADRARRRPPRRDLPRSRPPHSCPGRAISPPPPAPRSSSCRWRNSSSGFGHRGLLRPAHRRYLALVPPQARHRRRHHRQRQLPRRCDLAGGAGGRCPARAGAWSMSSSPSSSPAPSCRSRNWCAAACPTLSLSAAAQASPFVPRQVPWSPRALMWILALAGVGCCVAMSMPQVHIVALLRGSRFGVARGAEMLSLMLVGGVVSRLVSGVMADYSSAA